MIQVFIWVTAIYYVLAFLEGVMTLSFLKIIGYGILAFMGVVIINHASHEVHTYIVASFISFLLLSLRDVLVERKLAIIPIILTLMAIACF